MLACASARHKIQSARYISGVVSCALKPNPEADSHTHFILILERSIMAELATIALVGNIFQFL